MEIKVHKSGEFTVMSNYHLRDKEMSLKAKGILSIMLSLPAEWDYSVAGLQTLSKDGKDSTTNALNELETLGYLVRTKVTDERGRFNGYNYDIYEKPQTGKPLTGNPPTENPQQYNNKKPKMKEKENLNINLIAEQVLDYLNEKAETHFKPVESNLKFIKARLKDYTESDLKAVVDKKTAEWKGTQMQMYLRPETLFNATKFESYINGLTPIKEQAKGNEPFKSRDYTKQDLDGMVDDIDDVEF